MKVAVYLLRSSGHSTITCPAMAKGVQAAGDNVKVIADGGFQAKHAEEFDVAVFWGYVQTMQDVMTAFRAVGKSVVYIDLGYFERAIYYKIAINARHPTAYFQKVKHGDDRRRRLGLEIRPEWNRDGYILLAGMGRKAAWAEKLEPVESWERATVALLAKSTDRQIVYRPKPSQRYGQPIPGAKLDAGTPIDKALSRAFAVVTHHSNVAVDGLVRGVPAFVLQGVAAPLGLQDISKIETPRYPEDREQWLNDVAYCQWSLEEMGSGAAWKHLRGEAIV